MDGLGIQSWTSLAAGGLALWAIISTGRCSGSLAILSGHVGMEGGSWGCAGGFAGLAGVALRWLAVGSKSQRLNAAPSSSQANQAANGPGMSSAPCRIRFSMGLSVQ